MSKEIKIEHYNNAPIIMAVAQIRYQKVEDFNSKKIKQRGDSIKEQFPIGNEQLTQTVRLDPSTKYGETKVSLDNVQVNGVLFASPDTGQSLNVEPNKFTFQIDGKYPGWDDFYSAFSNLWNHFNDTIGDVEITGVSVRYLNSIILPNENIKLEDYFNVYIYSPVDFAINQFQMKYTSPHDNGIMSHIAHAIVAGADGQYQYMLDMDIINQQPIEKNNDNIAAKFQELRELKNNIFNGLLTEKTKKIIR